MRRLLIYSLTFLMASNLFGQTGHQRTLQLTYNDSVKKLVSGFDLGLRQLEVKINNLKINNNKVTTFQGALVDSADRKATIPFCAIYKAKKTNDPRTVTLIKIGTTDKNGNFNIPRLTTSEDIYFIYLAYYPKTFIFE